MREQRPVLNLPTDLATAEDWRGALAGLARDEGEMEAALDEVRAERRTIALAIACSEPAAVKRNAELNVAYLAILERMDLLLIVRGSAQDQLKAAEAAEGAAEAVARRERLQAGGQAAERAAAECDAIAGKLTESLAAYRTAVSAMIPAGLDSARVNTLLTAIQQAKAPP